MLYLWIESKTERSVGVCLPAEDAELRGCMQSEIRHRLAIGAESDIEKRNRHAVSCLSPGQICAADSLQSPPRAIMRRITTSEVGLRSAASWEGFFFFFFHSLIAGGSGPFSPENPASSLFKTAKKTKTKQVHRKS